MKKPSVLKAAIEGLDDLPADILLGRIVLFTITEEPIKHADVVAWFDELDLDPKHLPLENKAIDAFKKATSDTKDSYDLSSRRTAHVLCRDVATNTEFVRRQITREIKDGGKRRLSYDEAITCTFYRATDTSDQTTSRLGITVVPGHLGPEELPEVRRIARDIRIRYDHYFDHLDSQKIRAMVRGYLKKLNAIEIKGGVYFVHASKDVELTKLSDLVSRLGGGCHMDTIPMADLEQQRRLIVRTFEREATETLRDLTKEIEAIASSREKVTDSTYARLKGRYDEVLANAEEHILTLQISQDSTTASAEIALEALTGLTERMLDS